MRLLVLGGTEFVGRAFLEEALRRGDEVTVFHRGRHPAPSGVTALHGDRTEPDGLAAFTEGAGAGLTWDAVVDTWTGAPAEVGLAARLLAGRAERFAYVSSRSVHRYPAAPGLDENGPLVEGRADDTDSGGYERAKRGGELAALAAFGDRTLLPRPGLVIGPGENVGRLPWWLGRAARGGPMLAPGPADLPLQYIDARDLALWTLDALGRGLGGPYNVVSPRGHTTMSELLEAVVRVTGGVAEPRWTDPKALVDAGVEPWMELPVWTPPGELHDTLHCGDVSRALAEGLRCRPVAETVADTWEWLCALGGQAPQRPDRPPLGMAAEREAELLARLPAAH
ncbi:MULTISPECIES: NAD-dependent epimerase/dehydratase family protein [unclassified Streptomyces]|uniref:NAD-dependent epimerase/dehydratase family protein n=1 Tax=unclassified Streptomyces TaxID=2593676 RepID=UPI002DD7E713|nr:MULTISPECIES: NAD-dependent epimerase/dehydratase family protein [unclassified Streptomyces]WSB79290.1 NAD-dependent epimerase/dehydratase family protein [Streptomyces sp. NBC_01775]WSS12506.1 NAD-dependent epimerase/dehydratase family protein [Streptomyces sp. NBC_01186]WSS41292.1 NAD-dependent epimerase/dehydratase family protein [Streptomyces sp. NBC_01187]